MSSQMLLELWMLGICNYASEIALEPKGGEHGAPWGCGATHAREQSDALHAPLQACHSRTVPLREVRVQSWSTEQYRIHAVSMLYSTLTNNAAQPVACWQQPGRCCWGQGKHIPSGPQTPRSSKQKKNCAEACTSGAAARASTSDTQPRATRCSAVGHVDHRACDVQRSSCL